MGNCLKRTGSDPNIKDVNENLHITSKEKLLNNNNTSVANYTTIQTNLTNDQIDHKTSPESKKPLISDDIEKQQNQEERKEKTKKKGIDNKNEEVKKKNLNEDFKAVKSEEQHQVIQVEEKQIKNANSPLNQDLLDISMKDDKIHEEKAVITTHQSDDLLDLAKQTKNEAKQQIIEPVVQKEEKAEVLIIIDENKKPKYEEKHEIIEQHPNEENHENLQKKEEIEVKNEQNIINQLTGFQVEKPEEIKKEEMKNEEIENIVNKLEGNPMTEEISNLVEKNIQNQENLNQIIENLDNQNKENLNNYQENEANLKQLIEENSKNVNEENLNVVSGKVKYEVKIEESQNFEEIQEEVIAQNQQTEDILAESKKIRAEHIKETIENNEKSKENEPEETKLVEEIKAAIEEERKVDEQQKLDVLQGNFEEKLEKTHEIPDQIDNNIIEIRWNNGGNTVCVAGEWNGWQQIPLEKHEDNSFSAKLKLETGSYFYKFVVDGNWVCDDTANKKVDSGNNINNFIEIY